jgi:hypothetical protein
VVELLMARRQTPGISPDWQLFVIDFRSSVAENVFRFQNNQLERAAATGTRVSIYHEYRYDIR